MNTRSRAQGELISLEHNLEATLRRNKRKQPELSATDSEVINIVITNHPIIYTAAITTTVPRMADQQSIRDLSSSVAAGGIPLCIAYPEPAQEKSGDIKLNSSLLHRILVFHGHLNEDLNMHLMEFQFVCSSMLLENADEDIMKIKAFPFSLADRAKEWLYKLPHGHIQTWSAMHKVFLKKYFPTSRVITLRKQITGIAQTQNESFSQYYEMFQTLWLHVLNTNSRMRTCYSFSMEVFYHWNDKCWMLQVEDRL